MFGRLAFAVGALTACAPDVIIDGRDPVAAARAEFDPAASIVPFPNDLLRVHERVSLPPRCHELPVEAELRSVLNSLDGFGAHQVPLVLTFTEPVDAASLDGRVWLFPSAIGEVSENPAAAVPVPVTARVAARQRWDLACETSATVNSVTLVPALPLTDGATYAVAVLDGVVNTAGTPFQPSVSWALVRDPVRPVEIVHTESGPQVVNNLTAIDDIDTLVALNDLWRLHAPALAFLDVALARWVEGRASPAFPRGRILSAWSFTTQTVVPPLDATADAGPASELGEVDVSLVPSGAVQTAFEAILGAGACARLPCTAVATVLTGTLNAPRYQARIDNAVEPSAPLPGPWDHPTTPALVGHDDLPLVAFVPAGETPPSGWPLVVFGHGLGGAKENLFAIAGQLAAAGVASVAIDWVAHGARAVRISVDAASACDGERDPTASGHCFAPLISADLATTRDSLRQSVLDALALVRAVSACGCSELPVDGDRVGFVGQSLGALLGGVIAATGEFDAAVLSTGGAGWVDVLVHTETAAIKCPLVDALIDAGVLSGNRWNAGLNDDALCLTDSWKTAPELLAFAANARWILDAVEPTLFAERLSERAVLVQQVVGDPVVPNRAQELSATLLGLSPSPAAAATSATPTPSAAVVAGSAWITYADLPAELGFPGNSYGHGSLLSPGSDTAGELGSAQMQADAIGFLLSNL